MVSEDRYVAQLRHFLEEFSQVGPFVDVDRIWDFLSLFLHYCDFDALWCLDTAIKFLRRLSTAKD